jgi:hypothetical protein
MAYDEARKVAVLVQFERTSETWVWDGDLWVQVADIGPIGIDGLVWDPVRNLLIATSPNSLWEWSGEEWTQVNDVLTGQGTTVFDDRSQQILRVTFLADSPCVTWAWADSAWTQIDAKGPPTRNYFELVSDRARGVVVLVGGALLVRDGQTGGFTMEPVRDTWIWDGHWKVVSDMGPSPRTNMSVAYDRARGRTILLGGATTDINPKDPYVNDTWEWDGALWRQIQNMGPSRRGSASMTHDPNRNRTILFGGGGPDESWFADTWEYFDHT